MGLVFQAHDIEWVKAPYHSDSHFYRVAFGYEAWEEGKPPVGCFKVQMAVKEGEKYKVLGRQAPSFPTRREYEDVQTALKRLFERNGHLLPAE